MEKNGGREKKMVDPMQCKYLGATQAGGILGTVNYKYLMLREPDLKDVKRKEMFDDEIF